MEEAVEELIGYIMMVQDEGPYLLGGYCNGGYVAYEIARRLVSRGHRVDLLALVESPVLGHGDRLFRVTRGLLFSMMRPSEMLRYLAGRRGKITRGRVRHGQVPGYAGLLDRDYGGFVREFDRVFGEYCWERLGSGLPTYPGRLTLLYSDRSVARCFPTRGWKELVKGGIEVHVARCKGYVGLFDNLSIHVIIHKFIYNSIISNRAIVGTE
jgi:hypothetical protein